MRGRLGDVGLLFSFTFSTSFTSCLRISIVAVYPFHRGTRDSGDRMGILDENGGSIHYTGDQADDRGLPFSPSGRSTTTPLFSPLWTFSITPPSFYYMISLRSIKLIPRAQSSRSNWSIQTFPFEENHPQRRDTRTRR
jgi:hypothetical protein